MNNQFLSVSQQEEMPFTERSHSLPLINKRQNKFYDNSILDKFKKKISATFRTSADKRLNSDDDLKEFLLDENKEDGDEDEATIFELDHDILNKYGNKNKHGRIKKYKRVCLWSIFCCIGLPVGFFLLMTIVYAILFYQPTHIPGSMAMINKTNLTVPARVLTFNIFMRPLGVNNNGDDYKDERLQYIIKDILPNYDIIAFQEAFAFGNHRIDRLIQEAQQNYGFDYIMSPRHQLWHFAADGGLLLLSKYRIVTSNTLEFPRGIHSDHFAYKGALHGLIELDATTKTMVHVFTSHLQSSYLKNGQRSKEDVLVRLEQFSRLHQFIHQTTQDNDNNNINKENDTTDIPVVVMGDFNIDSAIHTDSITVHSKNSSQAYTMMMDVLIGNGIQSSYFTDDNENNEKWFMDKDWKLPLMDVVYETYGYHPITYADYKIDKNSGSIIPAEVALTSHDQLLTGQSIDQLLWLPPSPVSTKNTSSVLLLSNVTIEHFFVANESFTQLSDHYGISCLLSV